MIALTFDACGGKEGSGYDEKLIDYLIKENIPATLFINARWITANKDIFAKLAANPLFEIENHGTVNEVIREVKENADQIEKLTGRRPLFFRSGTAYYDDIAAGIMKAIPELQKAGYRFVLLTSYTLN